MKKIALCSLLACMVSTVGYAENTCRVSKTYDGYDATSDEYLFPDQENYLIAKGAAEVYECDKINSSSCTDKEIITMPANHYFGGKVVTTQKTYKCNAWTVGNDKWEPFTPVEGEVYNTCDTKKVYDGHDATSDEYLFADKINYERARGKTAKVYECDKIATSSCQDQEYITMPANHVFEGNVIKKSRKYKCEALTIGDDKWVPEDEGKNVTPGYCDQFKAYPQRYACCIAGNATEWIGSLTNGYCKCVDKSKTWDGSKCAGNVIGENCQRWKYNDSIYSCCMASLQSNSIVDFDNNTGACRCKDNTKTWNGTNCIGNGGTPDLVRQCDYVFDAELRCANGAYLSQHTRYPLGVNTGGKTCEEFRALFASDKEFMLRMLQDFCSHYNSIPVVPDDKAFNAAKDSLNSFFSSAKSSASVWKNSEGKFNTARLASDLTAGVVLGTVGGVVSGVVIKKKQIEKGFEALHCTVGGQKVADWGDEFNIGFRR